MRYSKQFVAALALGAGLAAGLSAGAASARPAEKPAHFMRLGSALPSPPGFMEFCARRPEVCGLESPAAGPYADERPAAATRGVYSAAFWRAALAVDAPAATRVSLRYSPAVAPVLPRADEAVAAETVETVAEATGEKVVLPLDRALWKRVVGVNRKVNGLVRERSDLSTTGMADQWNLPIVDGTLVGDCEDYALEKRRLLIEAGLPAGALSLAIVRTAWGQSHAVLLVSTDRGEYVLDSLSPWVTQWSKLNYTWVERQAPGSMMRWVSIMDPSGTV